MKKFEILTDMATEKTAVNPQSSGKNSKGIKREIFYEKSFRIESITANENDYGLPFGKYFTLETGDKILYDKQKFNECTEIMSKIINYLRPSEPSSPVLTVCLGNPEITSDSVGAICFDNLTITRHLKGENPELFKNFGSYETSALMPNVMGKTGIETFDMVYSAVKTVKPSCVICVDALAARDPKRLLRAFQVTNTGISPGSGVGNSRKALNAETLGIPVISVGVPTVVHTSVLIYDILKNIGITEENLKTDEILKDGMSFYVTPKADNYSYICIGKLIAHAINSALTGLAEL